MAVTFVSFLIIGVKVKIDLYFILSQLKNTEILKTIILLVLLYGWETWSPILKIRILIEGVWENIWKEEEA
jgi:hypothetical protein